MAERLVEPPAGREPRPPDRGRRRDRDQALPPGQRRRPRRAGPAGARARRRRRQRARGPTVTVERALPDACSTSSARSASSRGSAGRSRTTPAAGDFVFDVVEGVDRQGSVFFDFAFETLERWEELDSVIDAKTVALVAGQGEGTARDIATRWSGTEPTGFDRREAFLDARDVELGETTILDQRGDAFLAADGRRDEPRGRRPPVRRLPLPGALGRRRHRHRAQRRAGLELPRPGRRGREGVRAERRRARRSPRPSGGRSRPCARRRPAAAAPRPPTGP